MEFVREGDELQEGKDGALGREEGEEGESRQGDERCDEPA